MNTKHLAAKLFTRGLKRFSNIHKGESCYIFGDGPSLKWFDLSKFSDLPALCCGMIPFHKDFKKLDVRYVTLVEPWIFAPRLIQPKVNYLSQLRGIAEEYRRFINVTPEKEFFVSLSNAFWLKGQNINYVYRSFPALRNDIDGMLSRYDLYAGSFHATLSLAYYLGFKKIYLVGFDAWTIQPARASRWYELGAGEIFETKNFAEDFLEILKRDVEIYTISHSGTSCNVSHIDYEVFTGIKPCFRENYELMSDRYLKIMSTFPDYNIYPNKNV